MVGRGDDLVSPSPPFLAVTKQISTFTLYVLLLAKVKSWCLAKSFLVKSWCLLRQRRAWPMAGVIPCKQLPRYIHEWHKDAETVKGGGTYDGIRILANKTYGCKQDDQVLRIHFHPQVFLYFTVSLPSLEHEFLLKPGWTSSHCIVNVSSSVQSLWLWPCPRGPPSPRHDYISSPLWMISSLIIVKCLFTFVSLQEFDTGGFTKET